MIFLNQFRGTRVFRSDLSPSNLDCVLCNFETSGAHYQPGCNRFVDVHCGRTQGEEGYGSSVYCNKCEVANATRKQIQLLLESKGVRIKCITVCLNQQQRSFVQRISATMQLSLQKGQTKITSRARSMLGVITDVSEGSYSVGTRYS